MKDVTQEELDSAQRMAEAVNLHVHALLAEGSGRTRPGFVAIRLADGRSPTGDLYDSRSDAVRHNRHEGGVFYAKVGRETMPAREALIVLQMARMAYKRGVVFAEEDLVTPHLTELMGGLIPRTLRGLGRHN
jgi:hypothetical protein